MANEDENDTARTVDRPANWNGDGSAMRTLDERYGEAIRAGTLHAHELRQLNPKLYESLAQLFARNKAKDLLPAAFADVMPVYDGAKGGWRSRAPSPPPSAEEALLILLRQREAARKRKQRYRQTKPVRETNEQPGVETEGQSVDEPNRSSTFPANGSAKRNTCG